MTNAQLIKKVQEPFLKADRVEYKTGMEVEVSQTIREWWKERVQKFKWIIIKTAGKTPLEKTITVRRKIWSSSKRLVLKISVILFFW